MTRKSIDRKTWTITLTVLNTKNLAFILLCEISKCFFKIIALAFGLCFDILRLFTVQRISMVIMKKFYKDSCFLTLCVPYDTCGLNCYFSSFRKSFLFSLNEGLQIIFKSTMDKQKKKTKPWTHTVHRHRTTQCTVSEKFLHRESVKKKG